MIAIDFTPLFPQLAFWTMVGTFLGLLNLFSTGSKPRKKRRK